jgi:hypothetical protein
MGGEIDAWNVAAKTQRVLAGQYDGKRLNAPNDQNAEINAIEIAPAPK